jgi:sortase (surface protein transpeptidase)
MKFMNLIKNKALVFAAFFAIGGLAGSSYFGYKIVHSQDIPAPVNSVAVAPQATQASLGASQPVRLVIPKIGVNAPSINLNLKADGTLETPNSPTQVGWYRNSPTPGEMGPAIITAHVDYINYGPAVFWDLGKLTPGDTFEVMRVDGSTAKFKVDAVKQYEQDNFPTNEVYGNTNYAAIRLITCSGSWNAQTHHYSDNTVVFGSLVTN